ncbi:BTAD domain-containing putative transcriptional regulator [Clostridiaceae bacterium 35-E11]
MLKINLLGEPTIMVDNQDITQLVSTKAVAILAYLVMKGRSVKVSREKIASLFWNESSRKSAKYNLRYTLWLLKKVLKDHGIKEDVIFCPDKEHCYLNPDIKMLSDTDVLQERAREISEGNWKNGSQCIELYRGEFLQGINIRGNAELDDWIIYEREKMQRIYFQSLSTLSDIFLHLGKYKQGVACLERLLHINPLDEEIYRRLMKMYYLDKDRVTAMQQYEKCSHVLRTELNISPMEETTRLYQNIKHADNHLFQNKVMNEPTAWLAYFHLTEIVEEVIKKTPAILEEIHPAYIMELSKLIPEIQPKDYNEKVSYLSVDIEKIRIFRAGAQILKAAKKHGKLPTIKMEEMDQVTKEFLRYIAIKYPQISMAFEVTGKG